MTTRREFLLGVGGALFLASGTHAQTLPNKTTVPTPAEVVQQYLTARAAGDYTAAYSRLSAAAHQQVPFAQFADGSTFPGAASHAAEDGVSPLMEAMSVLFMDSHNAMGYRFTVLGPDPFDPHAVQVRALPAGAPSQTAFLLEIVTAPDAMAVPRIETLASYQKTSPADMERMREKAEAITSLSNLRQIGLAIVQYAQDHQSRMPDADRWVDQISPYLAGQIAAPAERERIIESLMHDPSAPAPQKWNYAFNSRLSGLSLAKIEQPSKTVLVFESITGARNAADSGASVPHPGRHDGGSYYVSADGHAQWCANVSLLSFAP